MCKLGVGCFFEMGHRAGSAAGRVATVPSGGWSGGHAQPRVVWARGTCV